MKQASRLNERHDCRLRKAGHRDRWAVNAGLGASPFGYKIAEQFGLNVRRPARVWCHSLCINRCSKSYGAGGRGGAFRDYR